MRFEDLDIEGLQGEAARLWDQATSIWTDGGWAMIAIAVIALLMFSMGLSAWVRLSSKGFQSVPERRWRHWLEHRIERKGPIGRILDFVGEARSLKDVSTAFDQLHSTETAPFDRDLKVIKICVASAPLVGLLGTVTGMLTTFDALSSGAGGDQTMGMIAGGISEALITTETGLVIALPGLFMQYLLTRKHDRYKAFLAHVETVCTQKLYRQLRRTGAVA
ncbi:MAG: MotA/TolQ/ExbB proton channel family protein [Planctomycetota bacterium]|nr:MotA/TolQ/ExbB proton channel family protein [Planctomycetota bacterium]